MLKIVEIFGTILKGRPVWVYIMFASTSYMLKTE